MAKNVNFILGFRKLAAVFLFGIFAYSTTPVIFLHDVFASHHDVCYHNFTEAGKQLSKADINCSTIFFVAEAQFVSHLTTIRIAPPETMFASGKGCNLISFYSRHHLFTGLRGPPAIA